MSEAGDLIIVGSGPAAWSAAIYASRAALSPIVLAGEQGGGQLMLTTKIENYPGFPDGILGPDLMAGMRRQAERQGVKIIDKNAVKLEKSDDLLIVSYGNPIPEHSENSDDQNVRKSENQKAGNSDTPILRQSDFSGSPSVPSILESKAVIIATGATANTLKLPGEDRLMGRGVGTCAVCDAPFYKGKNLVLVIGGGDSAMEEAGELAKFVNKVVILVRKDVMRASAILQNRIKALQNVEIWYKTEAKEFLGDKLLEKVRIVRNGQEEVLAADGVFYAIGHTPATEWLKGSGVNLDAKGYILTGLGIEAGKSGLQLPSLYPTSTSISGVFAAGDCVDSRYRQAITAAGYGCMAALDAQKWLENNG